jgi:hypothetical protein
MSLLSFGKQKEYDNFTSPEEVTKFKQIFSQNASAKEVEAIVELLDAASYHPKMISLWIVNAVEGKDPARE